MKRLLAGALTLSSIVSFAGQAAAADLAGRRNSPFTFEHTNNPLNREAFDMKPQYLFSPVFKFFMVLLIALAGISGASAQQKPSASPVRPLVLVPGLLGSKLCRTDEQGNKIIVWGTLGAILKFPDLILDGSKEPLEACGLIREMSYLGVYTQDFYAPFLKRLEAAGYVEQKNLLIFDYDWRLSVFENAERLADFLDQTVAEHGQVDMVAHSMGGLIARTYIMEGRGAERVHRLITAGTPWRGSVQVFDLLENGWGTTNLIMGGLKEVRKTIMSFPSLYELMPAYDGCCLGTGNSPQGFQIDQIKAWVNLKWEGIDTQALPDFRDIKARQNKLSRIVEAPLPNHIEDVLVIGIDQRTPEFYRLKTGKGPAHFDIHTSWNGDGTVMRNSALLQDRITFQTRFAIHDTILNETSVQDFIVTALERGAETAIERVPVRKRSSLLSRAGKVVELVGVDVAVDQPLYQTDKAAKAIIHIRLGEQAPIAPNLLDLVITHPGGSSHSLALTPDLARSNPGSPFEQTFSADFETGPMAGALTLTLTLESPTSQSRIVTHSVPVVPQ